MSRPKVNLDAKEEAKAKKLLIELVRGEGGRAGNITLLDKFLTESNSQLGQNFAEEVYWNIRNSLVEDGKLERGRGKGGTVFLLDFPAKKAKSTKGAKKTLYRRESDLYVPFHKTIDTSWVQENGISEHVSEITAHKGRTDTGGKWTRPDVTLVGIGNYEFLPGKTLEVITFEIKPEASFGIQSVYETASHSAFANESYLAVHVTESEAQKTEVLLERLESESVRLGIGLIVFENPAEFTTFDVRVDAQHKTPNPRDMNDFLSKLLNSETKQKLLKAVK